MRVETEGILRQTDHKATFSGSLDRQPARRDGAAILRIRRTLNQFLSFVLLTADRGDRVLQSLGRSMG